MRVLWFRGGEVVTYDNSAGEIRARFGAFLFGGSFGL